MINHYKLITITHKGLNTEDLEHFMVRHSEDAVLANKLEDLKKEYNQKEILYLTTCNRVMYFMFGKKSLSGLQFSEFFQKVNSSFSKSNVHNLEQIVEYYEGAEAVNHLFEVASSLDSLVVGEREIFRQFREAYKFCKSHNLCGDNIRLVEQSTVRAAKDVYTNTSIGTKPVSVVSLAIQEFLQRDIPTTSRILLIGSGETNSTVGRFLRKYKYHNIVIFNRTLDNAQSLSTELGAEARHLGSLGDYQEGFDCIFACTAAQDPIITSEIFERISPEKKTKLIIDLSIPHNVEKEVAAMDRVDYISIDSIRIRAEENLKFRSSNIAAARIVLSGHHEEFGKLYERRRVERALSALPKEIGKVKERALNLVYKDQLATLPQETQDLVAEIATYMEKKCVAVPMKIAKDNIR